MHHPSATPFRTGADPASHHTIQVGGGDADGHVAVRLAQDLVLLCRDIFAETTALRRAMRQEVADSHLPLSPLSAAEAAAVRRTLAGLYPQTGRITQRLQSGLRDATAMFSLLGAGDAETRDALRELGLGFAHESGTPLAAASPTSATNVTDDADGSAAMRVSRLGDIVEARAAVEGVPVPVLSPCRTLADVATRLEAVTGRIGRAGDSTKVAESHLAAVRRHEFLAKRTHAAAASSPRPARIAVAQLQSSGRLPPVVTGSPRRGHPALSPLESSGTASPRPRPPQSPRAVDLDAASVEEVALRILALHADADAWCALGVHEKQIVAAFERRENHYHHASGALNVKRAGARMRAARMERAHAAPAPADLAMVAAADERRAILDAQRQVDVRAVALTLRPLLQRFRDLVVVE